MLLYKYDFAIALDFQEISPGTGTKWNTVLSPRWRVDAVTEVDIRTYTEILQDFYVGLVASQADPSNDSKVVFINVNTPGSIIELALSWTDDG